MIKYKMCSVALVSFFLIGCSSSSVKDNSGKDEFTSISDQQYCKSYSEIHGKVSKLRNNNVPKSKTIELLNMSLNKAAKENSGEKEYVADWLHNIADKVYAYPKINEDLFASNVYSKCMSKLTRKER